MSGVAAIVLAAGRGTRFRAAGGEETSKLLAAYKGEALVRHAVQAALASGARPVLVVTGHAGPAIREALADLPVTMVANPDYATGLASSLRAGVAELPDTAMGAVVLLADMPGIDPALIDSLVEAAAREPKADAIVPTYGGEWGNPVLVARSLFVRVATLTGDAGARRLLSDGTCRVREMPCDTMAIARDIDTPADLAALPHA